MRFLLAAGLAVLPLAAFGQSNADEQAITVTATRTPNPVKDIPAGVTIIDRATIERRGYSSLVDALAAVPGLRVAQSGGPGAQASVFIRGTNSNQVLVLRDGVPVNDPGDPGGAFNFGVDTLGDVERIEIVRGPMSSLYGSGAIGGVINIITRRGAGTPHGSVTLGGGLPLQDLIQADVAGGAGIWDYAGSLESQSIRGFDQTPQRETRVYTGELDGDRNKQAQIEIGASPLPDTRVSLLLRARDAKFGYDEQYLVTYDGNNASGYDASLFGRLGVTSQWLDGAWKTNLYLTRLENDRRYTVVPDALDPNGDTADNRYHGRRTDLAWNNDVALPDWRFATATHLTFGYEHSNDTADSKVNSTFGGFPDVSLVRAHADTDSGYAELQTTLAQRLLAFGQVREDATTLAGDAFTWRLGATLLVPELATRVKGSYGTGFRAPALFDRYGIDNFGYVGNPNLRPERSAGWEAGFESELHLPAGQSATLSVEYFNNRLRDLIENVFVPIDTSVNIARARTQGVETSLDWRPTAWLDAVLAYTYTDARNLGSSTRLLRRPYNQGSADFRLTPWPGVEIAPELLYVGSFPDYLADNFGASGSTPGLSPSGWLFNLNASWQTTPKLKLFVWAKNLGGSRFEPVSGYQIPGASFLAGGKFSF